MSNYNSHKIYRVKELIDFEGNKKYQVQAADSWIEALFGMWDHYSRENESLHMAIDHIKDLAKWRKRSSKIVYRKRVSEV